MQIQPISRLLNRTILPAFFVCFVAYYIALLSDHLYMVNGNHYPLAMSHRVTVVSEGDRGIGGLTELCHGRGGWDFYDKDNGHFMRCSTILSGSLKWPTTYLIENYEELANYLIEADCCRATRSQIVAVMPEGISQVFSLKRNGGHGIASRQIEVTVRTNKGEDQTFQLRMDVLITRAWSLDPERLR